MYANLRSFLDLLNPWIDPVLIQPAYLDSIRRIGAGLPVLSLGCFECSLSDDQPRVDLNLCINPRVNEHLAMLDWPLPSGADISGRHLAFRQHIQTFCEKWGSKDFFLKPFLGELWAVYDLAGQGMEVEPWDYLSFLPTAMDSDPAVKAAIVLKGLQLWDPEYCAENGPFISRLLQAVPQAFRIGSLGMKSVEGKKVLRLYMETQRLEDVVAYLKQEHWPGDCSDLYAQLAPWTQSRYKLGLALDIDGGILPKIGLECLFDPHHPGPEFERMSSQLCALGLCSEAKRDALLRWDGDLELETDPAFWSWPDRFMTGQDTMPSKTRIKRVIKYIKMIYTTGQPLSAKTYLFFIRPVMRSQKP